MEDQENQPEMGGVRVVSEPTYRVHIYMSGPIEVAKHALREFCRRGLCVTIEPTSFIYTGGEESCFVVGLLNYPRFPASPDDIDATAREIALLLIGATFQDSSLVITPQTTTWITRRDQ